MNRWAVLTLAFFAFVASLYPVFLEIGFPSPSLCVTGGYEYWERHFAAFVRECAPLYTAPYGKPYGPQLIVDRFYMWGIPWLNSLLAAALCGFLGGLLVTVFPQPQIILRMNRRIRIRTEHLHT